MSKLKEANPKELYDRTERAQAKLARIARGDCWHGGARALVLKKRAIALGVKFDPEAVVSAAYSNGHNGSAYRFLAFECPECGSVVQGREKAYQHCAFDNDSE